MTRIAPGLHISAHGYFKMQSVYAVMFSSALWMIGTASVLTFEPSDTNSPASDAWPPQFCHQLDCPKYTVLKTTQDYEERQYQASHWVSTQMTGVEFASAQYTLFMRLFNYISGKNKNNETIAMTVPVLTRIIPGQGPACESNFTMSFFLSPKVTKPPQPSDKTVYLSSLPQDLHVYIRSFGGWATQSRFLSEAEKLASALPESAAYHQDYYFVAGYDSPFTIFNRHNEIWFIAK